MGMKRVAVLTMEVKLARWGIHRGGSRLSGKGVHMYKCVCVWGGGGSPFLVNLIFS